MIKRHVLIALFTAILFTVTATISIPIAYGFVNLSDTLIYLFASVLPLKYSFFIAAIGTSIADIFLGFGQYALFTFFIKGIEAVIVSKIENKNSLIQFGSAGLFMMLAYAITDVVLLGSPVAFLPSLSYNGIQALVSVLFARAFVKRFTEYYHKMNK